MKKPKPFLILNERFSRAVVLGTALLPSPPPMMDGWSAATSTHPSLRKLVYRRGNQRLKRIALTFDDGPSADFTPQVLEILERYNVKATFFLLGRNVERSPELARRVVSKGHAVGNHSYSHANLKKLRPELIREEISKAETVIASATGVRPTLFRAPFGRLNRTVVKEADAAGCAVIQWSLSPRDWAMPKDRRIARRVVSRARNGTIVLLHDAGSRSVFENRTNTVAALPSIIESLRDEGFEFVTVPELLMGDEGALVEAIGGLDCPLSR
jgi:peptidoglycan/xylan/chitin deacetylase (PgdA/CDA1 family)